MYGGHDKAPDPHDYVLAEVGDCTAVNLRQFAENEGWEIGDMQMTPTYDLDDGVDMVTQEIAFTGDLIPEQRMVLLRAADCGTERVLERGMRFVNRLVRTGRNSNGVEKRIEHVGLKGNQPQVQTSRLHLKVRGAILADRLKQEMLRVEHAMRLNIPLGVLCIERHGYGAA